MHVSFESSLTLTLDNPVIGDEEAAVLAETIKTILGVPTAVVTVFTTANPDSHDAALRGPRLAGSRRLAGVPVDIAFKVEYVVEDKQDPEESYEAVKQTLEDSVAQGTFTTELQTQSAAADVPTLQTAEATQVNVGEPVIEIVHPTPSPTPAPTPSRTSGGGSDGPLGGTMLIVAIAVVGGAVVITVYGVVVYRRKQRLPARQSAAVSPIV